MAVVLGTSSGFVTVAPTADPVGTGVTIDGSSVVTKDTSPATAVKITEIGWYRGSGTNAANYEVALYAEAAAIAATRLFVDATNSDTGAGWVRVPVNWLISGSTAYWLGLQMDSHTGSSTVDSAAAGGAGSDVLTGQTTLNSPYGGGAVADADGMYAIYALWQPVAAGAVVLPLTLDSTTAGTVIAAPQERFGAATQDLTTALVVVGFMGAFGSSVLPLALQSTSAGAAERFGATTQALTLDTTSLGRVEVFGAATQGLTLGLTTAGDVESGAPPQIANPVSDSVDGAWTTQDNGTDLISVIDEDVAADADYIRSELQPDNSACRIKLEGLSDPNSSTGHILRWRIAKDTGAGATVNMTLTLRQGGGDVLGAGTQIASFARSDVSEAFTTYEETLSGAEADAISDYSDLYLELAGDVA